MKLLPRRALIIGLGGLGCPASLALAHAGIEHLTLVDPDVVEWSNLHRQLWHHDADVGAPKVVSAAQKLKRAFPRLQLKAEQVRLDEGNALPWFLDHDVIVDGTDGVESKFFFSDVAMQSGTPLVYGGVVRFEGLAMRIGRGGPCLRCLFESPPQDALSCSQAGVLGPMAGLVGGIQASLALNSLDSPGESVLHVLDGKRLSWRQRRVARRSDCEGCAL